MSAILYDNIKIITVECRERPEHVMGILNTRNRPGRVIRRMAQILQEYLCPHPEGYLSEGGTRDVNVLYQCRVFMYDDQPNANEYRTVTPIYTLRLRVVPRADYNRALTELRAQRSVEQRELMPA